MAEVTDEERDIINDVNAEVMKFMVVLLHETKPMIVAGVMTSMALGLYKSILSPTEYELMVDAISASRDDINHVEAQIPEPEKRTLH